MVRYTELEKEGAVRKLVALNNEGSIEVDHDVIIENVRDLCSHLGISSYSLYNWARERGVIESKTKPKPKRDSLVLDSDEIDFVKGDKDFSDIFGIRFYGWLAKTMGIPSYSRLPLNQLLLKLGLKMIKESGLVSMIGDK